MRPPDEQVKQAKQLPENLPVQIAQVHASKYFNVRVGGEEVAHRLLDDVVNCPPEAAVADARQHLVEGEAEEEDHRRDGQKEVSLGEAAVEEDRTEVVVVEAVPLGLGWSLHLEKVVHHQDSTEEVQHRGVVHLDQRTVVLSPVQLLRFAVQRLDGWEGHGQVDYFCC